MYSWLNIGSLLFGLVAWILPITILVKPDKFKSKHQVLNSVASISSCVISLYFQMLYNNYLVRIEDWSALMDTSSAVVRLSFSLALGTIVLNITTTAVYNKKLKEL